MTCSPTCTESDVVTAVVEVVRDLDRLIALMAIGGGVMIALVSIGVFVLMWGRRG